jgi:hypothetical protein
VQFLLRNYSGSAILAMSSISSPILHGYCQRPREGGHHTALRFILQLSDAKARLFEDLEEQKNSWEAN